MLQKLLILFKLGYPSFWRKKNNLIEKIIIFILLPFSFLYFLISKIDRKIKKTSKVGIPVICVGNINTGGSGKTPFVIYLANLFKKKTNLGKKIDLIIQLAGIPSPKYYKKFPLKKTKISRAQTLIVISCSDVRGCTVPIKG